MAKKNNSIESIEIGIEEIRKIDILPLSLAAEKRIWNVIGGLQDYINELSEEFDEVPMDKVITKGLEVFLDNMELILKSVVSKEENVSELLELITNEQAIDIATCIYRNNIERTKKKIQKVQEKQETLKEKLM